MQTFERFLDDIIANEPDVILHTGDFFDRVRPSNHTIVAAYRLLHKVQARRNGAPFVIIAGNHESPRTVDSGCILRLFGNEDGGGIPGVYVFIDQIRSLELEGIEFLCIPTNGLARRENVSIRPGGNSKVTVLATHGLDSSLGLGSSHFTLGELNPDCWHYLALGDFHVRRQLTPNAWYCGSTDYTSSNIWEEASEPKGWIMFDSDKGAAAFHEVSPVRKAYDLPEIDAEGLSGEEIARKVAANANWPDEDEKPIVRQRVVNVAPLARTEFPARALQELKTRALHFYADFRLASLEASRPGVLGSRSLEDDWREYAGERPLPLGMQRENYVATGAQHIAEAADDSEEA